MTASDTERVLHSRRTLVFGDVGDAHAERLDVSAASGDGAFAVIDDALCVSLSGPEQIYRLRLGLGEPFLGNGVSLRIKASGWRTLSSVLIGYTHQGTMRRISIGRLWRERWVDVSFGQGDLCFAMQNGWAKLDLAEIADLHLHFTGQPAEAGASVAIQSIELWNEEEGDFRLLVGGEETTFSAVLAEPNLSARFSAPPSELLDTLYVHLERQYESAHEEAEAFLSLGMAPSYRTSLDWPLESNLPPALAEINSYRWSWQALHPVMLLLIHARRSGNGAAVFAARDFMSAWLERSYYQVDPDHKYTWYDHGVADRTIAMVMLWDYGVRLSFDQRFMARLLEALFRHCQLLGTEMFYAYHQPMRHHNHAVFQDLALMTAALAIPELGGKDAWFEIAAARLADQIQQLVVHEQDLAICVENSVGYHVGFQYLVEFAENLIERAHVPSPIPAVARGMARFSSLVCYADGRRPGLGDSARVANPEPDAWQPLPPYADPKLIVLHEAGHVFAKGNHSERPFMLCMSATSLTETHKHEDNLSFVLFFDGIEWLIDPSFHCYEPTQPVARYLRTALAHNGVALPNVPYSLAPGSAALGGTRDAHEFRIYGKHTAYAGVRVEREIRGRLDALELQLVDRVLPETEGFAEVALLMLQCGDGVTASVQGGKVTLKHAASAFELVIQLPAEHALTWHGEAAGAQVRGMTGFGFMQHGPITSIQCELAPNKDAHWSVRANRSAG